MKRLLSISSVMGVFLLVFALAACTPDTEGPVMAAAPALKAHIFSPDTVRTGSQIAGWRVRDIKMVPALDRPSEFVGTVRFEGETIVRGRFGTGPKGEENCFFVEPGDDSRLPRLVHDERQRWFCFDGPNQPAVVAGDTALTRIVIADYVITYAFTDAFDTARLVGMAPEG
jgi:hypothetical protein